MNDPIGVSKSVLNGFAVLPHHQTRSNALHPTKHHQTLKQLRLSKPLFLVPLHAPQVPGDLVALAFRLLQNDQPAKPALPASASFCSVGSTGDGEGEAE